MHIHKLKQYPLSRRSLFRLGTWGAAAALGSGMAVGSLTGCSTRPEEPTQGFTFLQSGDLRLFTALIPVLLRDMLPTTDAASTPQLIEKILKSIDATCSSLGDKAQQEIRKLLGLLNNPVTRWLTTGIWGDWATASAADVDRFMQRWHASSLGPFNAGFRVLSKLVVASYFGLTESRKYAGYTPLPVLYAEVNS